MESFNFTVKFEDGSFDNRSQKANTEQEAKELLNKKLLSLHKSPLFKGKKHLEIKEM